MMGNKYFIFKTLLNKNEISSSSSFSAKFVAWIQKDNSKKKLMSTRLAELREWGGPAHGPNKNGQNPSWNRHGLNNLKRKFLRISERGGKGNLTTKMYLVFLSFYTSLRSIQYWKHGKFSCTCYECKSLFVGTWSLVVIKNEEIQLQSTEPGKATNCPGCFLQNKHLYLGVLNWFH